MDTLLRDVGSAARRLAGQRGFTLAALLTLALGIGANTAMFSVVHGLLLRPLPYPDPERIVRVGESRGPRGWMLTNRSMPLLQNAESFEHLAAFREISLEWAGPDGSVGLRGAAVSPALFPLLRATPHLGRLFTQEEAREGADRVVLLSQRAWTNHFASDPDIVGAAVDLDGHPHTVVGVLPVGFYFPNPDSEFWTPFVVPPFTPPVAAAAGQPRMMLMMAFSALARLAPGVSPEQAAAEASTLLQNASTAFRMLPPGGGRGTDRPENDALVVPLLEEMVGAYRPALVALTMATALVLLIACINVAGLLLAQGVTRQRALAVCAALGASRLQLLRQLLTESVMLGVGGGVLGLAAASILLRAVPALVPGDIARLDEVGIDGVTLAFTLGISIAAGLLFGTWPALRWSRLDLARILNEGSTQSAAGGFRMLRSNRARATLAVVQVALALVLLTGAGLLLRSFVQLITVDRGYDPADVIAASVRNPDTAFRPGMTPESMADLRAAGRRFQESLVEEMARLEVLSDVEAVGVSSRLPHASRGGSVTVFRVAGAPTPTDPGDLPQAPVNFVSPGYFDAMRLRLQNGRAFTRFDRDESPPVLIVNQTLARELFGGEPAVGRRLLPAGAGPEPWEVIGVVADVRYGGLTVTESQAEAYMPLHQLERAAMLGGMVSNSWVAVRTASDPAATVPFLRAAVAAANPNASIDDVMTMGARLSAAVAQPRFYAVFVGFFAALALFLAAFGIYALLAYTVSQRRREIGVRMALGAQRGDVVALVVRQGAGLVAAGTLLGLLASSGSVRLLESFLFGVATDDPLAFVAAPLVLACVALVACWLPGHRAAGIDPMDALRIE